MLSTTTINNTPPSLNPFHSGNCNHGDFTLKQSPLSLYKQRHFFHTTFHFKQGLSKNGKRHHVNDPFKHSRDSQSFLYCFRDCKIVKGTIAKDIAHPDRRYAGGEMISRVTIRSFHQLTRVEWVWNPSVHSNKLVSSHSCHFLAFFGRIEQFGNNRV